MIERPERPPNKEGADTALGAARRQTPAGRPRSWTIQRPFSRQLEYDTDSDCVAGISAVVQVIPVVVANVHIVGGIPVLAPAFRPRVNHHEPKAVLPEAWITANYSGLAGDAEPVLIAEIECESGIRNVVAAIAAAFSPSAMLGLPRRGATLLPGIIPLPSAALF